MKYKTWGSAAELERRYKMTRQEAAEVVYKGQPLRSWRAGAVQHLATTRSRLDFAADLRQAIRAARIIVASRQTAPESDAKMGNAVCPDCGHTILVSRNRLARAARVWCEICHATMSATDSVGQEMLSANDIADRLGLTANYVRATARSCGVISKPGRPILYGYDSMRSALAGKRNSGRKPSGMRREG